jgi:hypothetical protein
VDNSVDKIKYFQYLRIFKSVAKRAKEIYYNNLFNDKVQSTKQIWTNLNQVISAKKNKSGNCVVDKLIHGNNTVTSPIEICNVMNRHFCTIGASLSAKLQTPTTHFSDYMCPPLANSIFVAPVTVAELDCIINTLKCNKSSGEDGFGPCLIKESKQFICEPVVYLFNLSLVKGIVPDKLKIAKVIPLFKKGDENLCDNYRHISLLSIFNKLLEKNCL